MPKVSELPAVASVSGADTILVIQGGTTSRATVSQLPSSGSTTPTGTGLRKVVAGVEAAAAATLVNADVDAAAAIAVTKLAAGSANTVLCGGASNSFRTIVNADVSASAAIAATKLAAAGSTTEVQVNNAGAIGAATNVRAGSGFLSVGASPAASGSLRIRGGVGFGLNALSSGSVDLVVAEVNASDGLSIWGTSASYGNCDINIGGGAAVRMQSASVSALSVSATQIKHGPPRIGWDTVYGSDGIGTQAMADANQTPASTVFCLGAILTTGAITANRTLTLPTATDAGAYQKTIVNACTGAFNIVVSTGAGTTVTVGNGKTAIVLIDSTGVRRVTADV
jgi:hypothetical protein